MKSWVDDVDFFPSATQKPSCFKVGDLEVLRGTKAAACHVLALTHAARNGGTVVWTGQEELRNLVPSDATPKSGIVRKKP